MDLANFVALNENFITLKDYKYFRSVLEKNFPEFKLKKEEIKKFIELLKKDKKASSKEIICILPKSNDKMIIHSIKKINYLEQIIIEYIDQVW